MQVGRMATKQSVDGGTYPLGGGRFIQYPKGHAFGGLVVHGRVYHAERSGSILGLPAHAFGVRGRLAPRGACDFGMLAGTLSRGRRGRERAGVVRGLRGLRQKNEDLAPLHSIRVRCEWSLWSVLRKSVFVIKQDDVTLVITAWGCRTRFLCHNRAVWYGVYASIVFFCLSRARLCVC